MIFFCFYYLIAEVMSMWLIFQDFGIPKNAVPQRLKTLVRISIFLFGQGLFMIILPTQWFHIIVHPQTLTWQTPRVVHYIVVGFKESTLPLKTVNIRHFIFVFYLVRILLKSLRKIIIILGGFKLEEEYKVIKSILQEHFIFYLLCIVLLTANSTFELTKQFYQNFFHLIYIINLESPNQKI